MDWKPTKDVAILFDDKTGESRTIEQLETMINELRDVSNKYNFDLSAYGTDKSLYKLLKLRFKNHEFKFNRKGNKRDKLGVQLES